MKALILVGGFGTRLRPMTLTCPKPLVPFLNQPVITHQIQALAAVGVDEVVLAVNYQPQLMVERMKEWEEKLGVKITYSLEEEPMGTAGPLALARKHLDDGEPFFVLNSDVMSQYPFADLLAFHRAHGGEGTILVTPVEDPSKYGVVVSDAETGRIQRFVEKPKEYISNRINAGMYIFNPSILDRIPTRPTSIEREIFPAMAADKQIYAMDLAGFWMDIGQPKDYLSGQGTVLEHWEKHEPERLAKGDAFCGSTVMHPSATVGNDCRIGPNVVIGPNVTIADGVRLSNCVLFENVQVRSGARIDMSIIGWNNTIGRWVHMGDMCSTGDDVAIKDEVVLRSTRVLPHKSVGADATDTIIM